MEYDQTIDYLQILVLISGHVWLPCPSKSIEAIIIMQTVDGKWAIYSMATNNKPQSPN